MDSILEKNLTELFGTEISNGPPITYMGGKFRYAKKIISFFPNNVTKYVEPFCGGAAIFFSVNKDAFEQLVINDLNKEIVNLFRCLQTDFWKTYLAILFTSNNVNTDLDSNDSYVRAASYYVLLTSSFNAQVHAGVYTSRSKFMPITIINRLITIRKHIEKAEIWNIDGIECIEKNDDEKTLFYIDPPYMIKAASKYYLKSMNIEQHKELFDTLANIKGKFVLSYEESEIMDLIIKNYSFNKFKLQITNSSSNTGRKQNESLITNFSPANIQEDIFNV